jgi:hypothetical protein
MTHKAIHPEALAGTFAHGMSQIENVRAVLKDILGEGSGNETAQIPGKGRHDAAIRSERAGGLLFTGAEMTELEALADAHGMSLVATRTATAMAKSKRQQENTHTSSGTPWSGVLVAGIVVCGCGVAIHNRM